MSDLASSLRGRCSIDWRHEGPLIGSYEACVLMLSRLRSTLYALLTYDFCPWANRWVYWMKRPIASLSLAAVVALACAIFVKPLALVACAAVLFVLALGYWWPWVSLRGLSATLRFRQPRMTEGSRVDAIIQITNRWPWPVWGISVEGRFDQDLAVGLARVAGRSTTEFAWEITPGCRGEYPKSPLWLTTGFPFGVHMARRTVTIEQKVLVWPRIMPLETLLDAAETRPSDDFCSDHRVGDSGDMTGTRPFRNGDSLRRVHWAQTARQGRMIVCERQAPSQAAIRVVFDSDPKLHRGEGSDSTLEWAIRIAASVCEAYHRENAHVECCFGHESIPLSHGPQGWKRFLDALSRWQPCHTSHVGDCGHEHDAAHCQRIHHHNCGVFQLTITTDLGLAHRTEHRHVHGDQRLVVLSTAAFAEPCALCHQPHPGPTRRAILLERPQAVAEDFRRKWRLACHVG